MNPSDGGVAGFRQQGATESRGCAQIPSDSED